VHEVRVLRIRLRSDPLIILHHVQDELLFRDSLESLKHLSILDVEIWEGGPDVIEGDVEQVIDKLRKLVILRLLTRDLAACRLDVGSCDDAADECGEEEVGQLDVGEPCTLVFGPIAVVAAWFEKADLAEGESGGVGEKDVEVEEGDTEYLLELRTCWVGGARDD